jgi:putative membrane protein
VADTLLKRLFISASVLFPFGIVFIGLGYLPAGWGLAHPLMIVFYAAIVFLWTVRQGSFVPAFCFLAGICVVSFAIEACAVRTGFPFGRYFYTDVLGFSILSVPAVIPLAWYATVGSSWGIVLSRTRRSQCPEWAKPILAALLVLALDMVLEPFAAILNRYWLWQGDRIPWINFLSWFLVAWPLALFAPKPGFRKPLPRPYVPVGIYAMQWMLFAFTDLKNGYGAYPAASLAVITAVIILAGRES